MRAIAKPPFGWMASDADEENGGGIVKKGNNTRSRCFTDTHFKPGIVITNSM